MRASICCTIVVVFILCNLPRLAVGCFELSRYSLIRIIFRRKKTVQFSRMSTILTCNRINAFYFPPTGQIILDLVAQFLAVVNSSANFLIYCLMGSQFREELIKMMKVCSSSAESSSTIKNQKRQSSSESNNFSRRGTERVQVGIKRNIFVQHLVIHILAAHALGSSCLC